MSSTPILGGQLVSIPGALEAIADGVVDSGFLITHLPAAALMSELTGLGTDPFATMGALNEAYFVDQPPAATISRRWAWCLPCCNRQRP